MLNRLQTPLILVAVIATGVLPLFSGPYQMGLVMSVLAYVSLVAAWNIISGYAGYLFLGSAAFYGLGMYINALLGWHITIFGAILVAAAVSFAVAFGLGIPFLRIRGPYFVIATLALSEVIKNAFIF